MRYLNALVIVGLLCGAGMAFAQGGTMDGTQRTQEQFDQLRDYVMDAEGAVQSAITDVNGIKKIKLSGYVQVRYENQEGGAGHGTKTKNTFSVRRARLKAAARPAAHTGVVLQADFGGTSPSLKDAYVEWYPTAAESEMSWMLTAGQLKWPFGYQVVQSSSIRETPERAQVIQRLFPGERDRGVMIASPNVNPLWFQAGFFNGTGANKSDDNNSKDFVGRLRWSALPCLDLGASMYFGKQLAQAPAAASSPIPVFADTNSNGKQDPEEPTIGVIAGRPARVALETIRTRYGADFQWMPLTGATVKAEYIAGKEYVGAVDKNRPINAHGWYAQATYAFRRGTTGVVMFDTYRDGSPENNKDIWHVGIVHSLTNSTRAKLFYQLVRDDGRITGPARRKDNLLQTEIITLF